MSAASESHPHSIDGRNGLPRPSTPRPCPPDFTDASATDAMNDLTPGTMPGLQQATVETPRQFITFTLDAQEYGVDIMRVREIKGWTDTTALPQAPPYVRGVINLRG